MMKRSARLAFALTFGCHVALTVYSVIESISCFGDCTQIRQFHAVLAFPIALLPLGWLSSFIDPALIILVAILLNSLLVAGVLVGLGFAAWKGAAGLSRAKSG